MKYFYNVYFLKNNKVKRVLYRSKSSDKAKQKFLFYYNDNRKAKFKENKDASGKHVQYSVCYATNNPFFKKYKCFSHDKKYKIIDQKSIEVEKKFLNYTHNKYWTVHEISDFVKDKLFYIFLNKLIIEDEKLNITIITFKNKREAKNVISLIINEGEDMKFLGTLNKKTRKKYTPHILKKTQMTYNSLLKQYIR